jgi:hypothetical protein
VDDPRSRFVQRVAGSGVTLFRFRFWKAHNTKSTTRRREIRPMMNPAMTRGLIGTPVEAFAEGEGREAEEATMLGVPLSVPLWTRR